MLDVVFYEVFEEERKTLKRYLPSSIRTRFMDRTIQGYNEPQAPSKLISIRTQSRIPLSWARELNGILTRSQGYDHLVAYCRAAGKDIACGYIDKYCSRAVAEQAVLSMMALWRRLKKQTASFETFSRDGLTGLECRGRRALVVGVGHIGVEIVDIVQALRMEARGVDPIRRHKGLTYVALAKGLPWADVVFCSCPLTDQTKGMLDYDALSKVKKGTIFINVGRGEISPIKDLKRLLEQGILDGLSLDVFDREDIVADSLRGHRRVTDAQVKILLGLKKREDVLLTPHNAFNTQEALEAKARLSAGAIRQFLREGNFPCPLPI